jgi:putative pyruvate formate lyase activating enzyme
MSQYHPISDVKDHPVLSRSIYREEYDEVVREMEDLGFRNGWVQDMNSNVSYRPDFRKENPFE